MSTIRQTRVRYTFFSETEQCATTMGRYRQLGPKSHASWKGIWRISNLRTIQPMIAYDFFEYGYQNN